MCAKQPVIELVISNVCGSVGAGVNRYIGYGSCVDVGVTLGVGVVVNIAMRVTIASEVGTDWESTSNARCMIGAILYLFGSNTQAPVSGMCHWITSSQSIWDW